jgi:hypothetical protein
VGLRRAEPTSLIVDDRNGRRQHDRGVRPARLDTYTPGTTALRSIYDGNEVVAELDSSGNILGRFARGDGPDELLVNCPDSGTANKRWAALTSATT